MEEHLNYVREIRRVVTRNFREDALADLVEEALHVCGSERRLEASHLVEDTTEGPDVAFAVVGLVLPNFGRGIVRCSCLGVEEPFLSHFRNIQVAKLRAAVSVEKNVGGFEIAMKYVHFM